MAWQPGLVTEPVLAAIDCGTNSTRLLVRRGATGETLVRENRITRLGAGVADTGRLAEDAIVRTADAVRSLHDLASVHTPAAIRITATSAARDATNRDALFDAIEAAVGQRPELLSGADEAALTFRGATAGLPAAVDTGDSDGDVLVIDIGGGSTEFVVGRGDHFESRSVDLGCVRLTDQYVTVDPPAPEELHACISVTQAWIDDIVRDLPAVATASTVIGVAGTVTTVAAVEIGTDGWDEDAVHHFVLERDAVEDVFRTLATEPREDRVHNPGLDPERADVIVAGTAVLVAIMRGLDLDEILVSVADILDGLIADMATS